MTMSNEFPHAAESTRLSRREAVRRVGALLGGVAFVGGGALLTACERTERPAAVAAGGAYKAVGQFSAADVALLDEIADTILPPTKTPGAKAAGTGPFMALMVTDTYTPRDQQVFRAGLRTLDEASRAASGAGFMQATPEARLALLTRLDREQKSQTDARAAADKAAAQQVASTGGGARPGTAAAAGKKADGKAADAHLPDARQQNAGTGDVAGGAAVTADKPPAHYFRMMKELALLGYFTSEIGYTKAMRYVDAPGRFDPCAPYTPGEVAWAPHA